MSALKHQMKGTNMKWHLRKKTERALHTLKCVSNCGFTHSLQHIQTHTRYISAPLPHTHSQILSASVCALSGGKH